MLITLFKYKKGGQRRCCVAAVFCVEHDGMALYAS